MTAADVLAEATTEDELLVSVLDLCQTLHLRTAHFRPARTEHGWRTPVQGDGKGWPDLVIAGSRMIIRELKRQREKPTADQQAWLDVLRADWRFGLIQAELQALRAVAR